MLSEEELAAWSSGEWDDAAPTGPIGSRALVTSAPAVRRVGGQSRRGGARGDRHAREAEPGGALLGDDGRDETGVDDADAWSDADVPAPVETLQVRLQEKRRARRRVAGVRIAAGVGVLALLAGLGWVLLGSSWLALRAEDVVVDGAGPYVDAPAVLAVVTAQEGEPLARLDTAGITAQLEAMPAVAEASVVRSWPHGATVTLVPREVVAVSLGADGSAASLVASDGVVVTTVDPDAAPENLPRITVDMTDPASGSAVTAVLDVLASLPPELLGQVAQAGATSQDDVTFTLTSGDTVRWGSAEENALKAQVLLTLLPVDASTYDVSAPEAPLTR
ncbi:MAG TPA: peptidase S9 [Micrococcales bacterium]|uniref:cell division protein FtsQ/DivIB n=1 Tax=Miniimonas arenae TaxID=676201 RepID=UPI000EC20C2B|nr:cell division protein FtsQ/DivIB [Miniimonas arenae]HCX83536.1 peptidase S9 [Micrococcales bacterium]